MLLRFRVANVLSFRDEQYLSFVATELNEGAVQRTDIRERGKGISVVPGSRRYQASRLQLVPRTKSGDRCPGARPPTSA